MFRQKSNRLLLMLLVILITGCLALLPATAVANAQRVDPAVAEAARFIANFHLNELDIEALPKTSMEELLEAVNDPHAEYLRPQEFQRFMEALEGSFGGVGIQISRTDGYITVIAPLPNTPAARAGLQSGDRILAADGRSLVGASTETAISVIRGQPGTQVTLMVERGGQVFQVTLERAVIKTRGPVWSVLEDAVGYLRIYTFGPETAPTVDTALTELKGKGIRSLIVDLRGNPGGLLETVVSIAGHFLPDDAPVVYIRGRHGQETLVADGKPLAIPLVFLVDEGSASGSEILAGAIQDYNLGALVGTNTFGKGSVQNLFELAHGGVLKMTTAKYLTPAGRVIEGTGLEPKHKVQGTDAQKDYALHLLGVSNVRRIVLTIAASEAEVAGRQVSLDDPPFIRQERTFVPLRFVKEAFGAIVNWDQERREVIILFGTNRISLVPGNIEALVNGKIVNMGVPPVLEKDRVHVPIRFVAEALGAQVDWDEKLSQVRIAR